MSLFLNSGNELNHLLFRNRFMNDHESEFPSLSNVVIGQLASRVPTKVGCESLFSVSGHVNDPRRMGMYIRLYERLVIGKHRMQRIYVSAENVKKRYMDRHLSNDWDEDEERDSLEYLELELEIWKQDYPQAAAKGAGDEEEDNGDDCENGDDGGDSGVEGSSGSSSDEEEGSGEEGDESSEEEEEGDEEEKSSTQKNGHEGKTDWESPVMEK